MKTKTFRVVKTTVIKDTYTIKAESATEAKVKMLSKWEDRCEILEEDIVISET